MRITLIILLVILSLTNCEINAEGNITKAYIHSSRINYLFKKLLEHLRFVLRNGSKFLGIPRLDPYKSGPINKFLNLEDIKGNISADSVAISGLSNYQVTRAEIKGLIIRMGFQWLNMEGNMTDYKITNGRFMNFINVFGLGDAVFVLKDLNFFTQITLEVKHLRLFIKKIESKISLGAFKFYTAGLYNNSCVSKEMSAVISEMGPEFVKNYQKELTAVINKKIMKIAKRIFRHIIFYEPVNFETYLFETVIKYFDNSNKEQNVVSNNIKH